MDNHIFMGIWSVRNNLWDENCPECYQDVIFDRLEITYGLRYLIRGEAGLGAVGELVTLW